MDAYRCPKCGSYVIGEQCYTCNINIRNYILDNTELPDILKDIFGDNNDK